MEGRTRLISLLSLLSSALERPRMHLSRDAWNWRDFLICFDFLISMSWDGNCTVSIWSIMADKDWIPIVSVSDEWMMCLASS